MNVLGENEQLISDWRAAIETRSGRSILPVGAGTKDGLWPTAEVVPLPMTDHRGIVSYDSSEFLITARAGTPISDIQQALSEKNQFLPFDPLFIDSGATLGGTLASGVSGPNRLLYGGIRDFVMEVAMLDGLGKLVRGGGKVVKNAAGFDTPKMMVGSYGRLGVLLEATLKVFPAPQSYTTLLFQNESLPAAVSLSQRILSKPFPIAGLDILPNHEVSVRLAAPLSSLSSAADRLEDLVGKAAERLVGDEDQRQQKQLKDWFEGPLESQQLLMKIAVSPNDLEGLQQLLVSLGLFDYRHSCAGTVTWVKLSSSDLYSIDQRLRDRNLSAVLVRGRSEKAFLGQVTWTGMAGRIQKAIDPNGIYPPWPESES